MRVKLFNLLIIFFIFNINYNYCQNKEEYNSILTLKDGKVSKGRWSITTWNNSFPKKVKFCISKDDCRDYSVKEVESIKDSLGLDKLEKLTKNLKKRNKKQKKRGIAIIPLIHPKIKKVINSGKNGYVLADLVYQGSNYDFYVYDFYSNNRKLIIITLKGKSKFKYYFSTYSSRKALNKLFNKFNCSSLDNAIKNKYYKSPVGYEYEFYSVFDKCSTID